MQTQPQIQTQTTALNQSSTAVAAAALPAILCTAPSTAVAAVPVAVQIPKQVVATKSSSVMPAKSSSFIDSSKILPLAKALVPVTIPATVPSVVGSGTGTGTGIATGVVAAAQVQIHSQPSQIQSVASSSSFENGDDAATVTSTNSATNTTAATTGDKTAQNLEPINRDGRNLSDKKIRRLEKNRLSARNCRRKKKEYTQNLQKEINVLEGENLRLRLQLQIGQEAEQSNLEDQQKETEELETLLESGATDAELFTNIEEFKEKFADYGRDRRSAMEFHLRNAKRLLMPTTTTSVAMRVLKGGSGGGHTPRKPTAIATATASVAITNSTSGSDLALFQNSNPGDGNDTGRTRMDSATSSSEGGSIATADIGINVGWGNGSDESNIGSNMNVQLNGKTVELESASTTASTSTSTSLPMATVAAVESTINNDPMNTASAVTKASVPVVANGAESTPIIDPLKPKSMFHYLVEYLKVTPAQAAALKDSRHVAKELDEALEKSLGMLNELKDRLTNMGQDLDTEFSQIRKILTPRQAAKFLVWVSNNGACMHMLNELWQAEHTAKNDSNDIADGK